MSAVLELQEVTKVYGHKPSDVVAVRDVSFAANDGEIVVILGPSGSGKTTLLNIAGCLMKPTSGTVQIMGRPVTAARERDLAEIRLRHIGFVFQSFNLLAPLTAEENVVLPMNIAHLAPESSRTYARQLLNDLDLLDRASRLPPQLSAGEQQRVAIARALSNRPELVLADEPTANLDSKTGHRVMQLLASAIERGAARALVVVTHDARVLDFATRVFWMEDGRLQEEPPGFAVTESRPAASAPARDQSRQPRPP